MPLLKFIVKGDMSALENVVIKSLFKSQEYITKVYPFIKSEYFTEPSNRLVFEQIQKYITEYANTPTFEAIAIQIDSDKGVNEAQQQSAMELLESVSNDTENTDFEWLYDNTEKWCKQAAIYNAITKAISITEGNDKLSPDAIPEILQDALAVSFDTDVGHDYFDDADKRYDEAHTKMNKIPFRSAVLNHVTNGGLPKRTLSGLLSPTGVGKTMELCSLAADYISDGYNVMYFTMEMSEVQISDRIDANLLDVDITDLYSINKNDFKSRISALKERTQGRLIVKQFGTGEGSKTVFRHTIIEAKHKKNFIPDVLIFDYLGICTSIKVKLGGGINTNTILKAISEELRSLCQEFNCIGWTATQANRGGQNSSDLTSADIADSIGLLFVLDFFVSMVVDEQMEEDGEILFGQLKNRYGSKAMSHFRMKMDRSRMRVTDHPDTINRINEYKAKKGKAPLSLVIPASRVEENTPPPPMIKARPKPDVSSLSFD